MIPRLLPLLQKAAFALGLALSLSGGSTQAQTIQAQTFEVETGLDILSSPATRIEGLHRLYVGRRVTPNWTSHEASSARTSRGNAIDRSCSS